MRMLVNSDGNLGETTAAGTDRARDSNSKSNMITKQGKDI